MKKLLSLPPHIVDSFHHITGLSHNEYFCGADPIDQKLGSGGGTLWLLWNAYKSEVQDTGNSCSRHGFIEWLNKEKRLVIHAGGQSRRLPAYAPTSKLLTPIPFLQENRGGHFKQYLLELQEPLCEEILNDAPEQLKTLVVSGDVLIQCAQSLRPIPNADIVCYGLKGTATELSEHGAFYMKRTNLSELDFMLQKPDFATQKKLESTHVALMDIGLWLLSDRALNRILSRCEPNSNEEHWRYYDLYGEFGCTLGKNPTNKNEDNSDLTVAIVSLDGGAFHHFGTSHELISSTMALSNSAESVFVQHSEVECALNSSIQNCWIENCFIGHGWELTGNHILTGIPENNWHIALTENQCIDIVPYMENSYVVRPYGFHDTFSGTIDKATTKYLGQPFVQWAAERKVDYSAFEKDEDLQKVKLFPVCKNLDEALEMLLFMLQGKGNPQLYIQADRLSAEDLTNHCHLHRLAYQRQQFHHDSITQIPKFWQTNQFYKSDLSKFASESHRLLENPIIVENSSDNEVFIQNRMLNAEICRLNGNERDALQYSNDSFSKLRQWIIEPAGLQKVEPRRTVEDGQISLGKSPVRIDLAGGWTDTPPFSLYDGGAVVNMAINLNHQEPIQVFVKPCKEPHIVCRSVDLGCEETIETYEQLANYHLLNSPFSIPKAALSLCGFLPQFCATQYKTLQEQLYEFGCGLEITTLAAIPAGSGLGTSSILSATVLAVLADFCGLSWDLIEIGNRTLMLEQLLTSGGGWQDQYGGILSGIKLLTSQKGANQTVAYSNLSTTLFNSETEQQHLLYYTGLTRTAKGILGEIVKNMFLNEGKTIRLLNRMKLHAYDMAHNIESNNIERYGNLIRKTWLQNNALDKGTCPPLIAQLCNMIDDYCIGYKLPGAGGGGFMYMVTKDAIATQRIKAILQEHPIAPGARFVDLSVSQTGLSVYRS